MRHIVDFHGVHLAPGTNVRGTYEQDEMDLAVLAFAPGDKVVVCGAGMGWLLAWIADIVGPRNVLGVEAIGYLVRLVNENVRVDGLPLKTIHGALTREGDMAQFSEDRNWSLSTTGSGQWIHGVSLHDLISDGWNCLALDIEGGEFELLDDPILSWLHKLVVEIHGFAAAPGEADALADRLSNSGMMLIGSGKRDEPDVTFQAWVR